MAAQEHEMMTDHLSRREFGVMLGAMSAAVPQPQASASAGAGAVRQGVAQEATGTLAVEAMRAALAKGRVGLVAAEWVARDR